MREVNLTRDEQLNLEEELQKYLEKTKKNYFREYEVIFYNHTCCVVIEWGDWKHDHLFCKSKVAQFLDNKGFACKGIDTKILEEDGSDCYSAAHYFNLVYK